MCCWLRFEAPAKRLEHFNATYGSIAGGNVLVKSFTRLASFQQCWDIMCWFFAFVWPRLKHRPNDRSNLKMVKFFMHHLWMLHNVVVVWFVQWCCARVCELVRFSTRNKSQHDATRWPNAHNMLRPTILRCVASKCCDRLARACKYCSNNVAISCADLFRSFGRGLIEGKTVLRGIWEILYCVGILKPWPNNRNIWTQQHYWSSICKLRLNDRTISTQHIATMLDAMLRAFGHPVATCCNILRVENRKSTHARVQHCCTNLAKRLQHSPGQTITLIWKWSNFSCNISGCCMML